MFHFLCFSRLFSEGKMRCLIILFISMYPLQIYALRKSTFYFNQRMVSGKNGVKMISGDITNFFFYYCKNDQFFSINNSSIHSYR